MEKVKEEFNQKQLSDSIDEAFPELADSEDEKVRKEILEVAQQAVRRDYRTFGGIQCNFYKWISWLNKQAKPKPTIHKFSVGDVIQVKNKSPHYLKRIIDMDSEGYHVEYLQQYKGEVIPYSSEDSYELVELA